MSKVEFEEDDFYSKTPFEQTPRGLAGFLINKGIVSNQGSANKLLLLLVAVFFITALFFASSPFSDDDLKADQTEFIPAE